MTSQGTRKIMFGVFTRDVYGLPYDVKQQCLVDVFDGFKDALELANKLGENSAVHLTYLKPKERK